MTIHSSTQDISQTITQYLNKAGAGFNKVDNWLGKRITEISKSFYHIGAKIGSTAEKIVTTALGILKSPYFQGALIVIVGLGVFTLAAKQLWEIRDPQVNWKDEYRYPVLGIVEGIAIVAVGIFLTIARV